MNNSAETSQVADGRCPVVTPDYRMTYSPISHDKEGLREGYATDGSHISYSCAAIDTDLSSLQKRHKLIVIKTDLLYGAAHKSQTPESRDMF